MCQAVLGTIAEVHGRLSGTGSGGWMFERSTPMAFVVWSTPYPGVGDEFLRWYDDVHLPDAVESGSFVAMHRFEAVGPGYQAAPYLAVAEAGYRSEAEAWAAVRPRAQALHDAGRIGDLYRVDFATMMLRVSSRAVHPGGPHPGSPHAGSMLTTVQNDWRHPSGDPESWLAGVLLPAEAMSPTWLLTTDPDGEQGPGRHLAVFESSTGIDETVARWRGGVVWVRPDPHRCRPTPPSSVSRRPPRSRRRVRPWPGLPTGD